jgi:hypothetical protein
MPRYVLCAAAILGLAPVPGSAARPLTADSREGRVAFLASEPHRPSDFFLLGGSRRAGSVPR